MDNKKHAEIEFSEITPLIYLGTNLCCGDGDHQEGLAKIGAKVVISLEDKRTEDPEGVGVFVWLPTKDLYPPSIVQLYEGIVAMEEAKRNNLITYVHCRNGLSRSPTLIIAYFMKIEGMNFFEAHEFVKKSRPEIHLHERQIEFLKEFMHSES
jgi:protein-tyrosine phosphatase